MKNSQPDDATLPQHWQFFNTPAGAMITRLYNGAKSGAHQLIPLAWVRDDRTWTTESPFGQKDKT